MPSPIAHGFAGYALMVLSEPHVASNLRGNLIALGAGVLVGSMADADFLIAHFTDNPVWQHHYFSHSIPFTLLIGLLAYPFVRWVLKLKKPFRMTSIVTAIYASHLLLDYFTHDGSRPIGIPLLWPLTDRHFLAPVEIFMSINRGSMSILFGAHNIEALIREALIMGPLALAAYLYVCRQDAMNARK